MANRTTGDEAERLAAIRATGVMTANDLRIAVRADKGRAELVEGLIRNVTSISRRNIVGVTERSNAATEERLKSGHAVGGVSIV